ncbi:hypothetical protein, partial [Streptomyces wuyuanensis]|uniref:hypothetical protein n=1 Tax=Streptomyces wuyuanensis TaxID=1196353 RepID=UPI00341D3636
TGPTGPTDITTIEITGPTLMVNPGNALVSTAVCAPGQTAISGGYFLGAGLIPQASRQSTTNTTGDSWQIQAFNPTDNNLSFNSYAYCVP